jgi:outer membrane biosynthesis protein TonB
MKANTIVLKNRLNQVVRTLHWDHSNKVIVVQREDNHRLEVVHNTKDLDQTGVSYKVLADTTLAEVRKTGLHFGRLGSIEAVNQISSLTPFIEISNPREGDFKNILRWTALAHLSLLLVFFVTTLLVNHFVEKPEDRVVQVIKQTPQKKRAKKTITVAASKKKVKKHKKKVRKKKVKKSNRKMVARKSKRTNKRNSKTTRLVKKSNKKNVGSMGALGVLGSHNPSSNRKGGFDVRKVKNRRAGGSGGSALSTGSRKTFSGRGLVAASPGTGSRAQRVGGYGTRGRAGGREGYGTISMVGSGAAYSTPVDSEALIEGGLGRDQVAAVIRRHLGEVRYCYEKGLQVKPSLRGRVAMTFVIGGNGRVKTAHVRRSSLRSKTVESCIVRKLKTWKFPRPVGNVNVKVTYPFVLKRLSQG